MASPYDKQFAAFLKRKRGDSTYMAFSAKVGLSPSTLLRLEQCQQSITLGRLHSVLRKLKCPIGKVLSDEEED